MMLKDNSVVEVRNIAILYCHKCTVPLFVCRRCMRSFNRYERVSCDDSHRCQKCINKSNFSRIEVKE